MSVWASRFEAMGFLENLLNRYAPRTPGKPVFAVIDAETEVSQVLFRLSRWENLEYAKKI